MNSLIQNKDKVSICHKDTCFRANGQNAEKITAAFTVMLVLVGIAAIIRAASN